MYTSYVHGKYSGKPSNSEMTQSYHFKYLHQLKTKGVVGGRLVRGGFPANTVQFSCSVMSDSATPWTAAHQASLSITISWSLLKLRSIESVMPSNHLILCCPLVLLPSVFPSIRVFSYESVLHIRWAKYWSFSFSISPSKEYLGLISSRIEERHSH